MSVVDVVGGAGCFFQGIPANDGQLMVHDGDAFVACDAPPDIYKNWNFLDAFREVYGMMESMVEDVEFQTGIHFEEADAILEKYKELIYVE